MFKDFIEFSNNNIPCNSIKIIANSDIYFDNSLAKIHKYLRKDKIFSLTRWNLEEDKKLRFYENFKSQDVWIFKGKLPTIIGNYYLGLPGCDNRFSAELKENGYRVSNPSLSIHANHIHLSKVRSYNKILDRVVGNYYYPIPNVISIVDISNKNIKLILNLKRKYHSSIFKNNLEGYSVTKIRRYISIVKLFALRLILKLV